MTGVLVVAVVVAFHSEDEVGIGTGGQGFDVLEVGRSCLCSGTAVGFGFVGVVGFGFVVGVDTQREAAVGFVGVGVAVLVVVASDRTAVLVAASRSRSRCWVD